MAIILGTSSKRLAPRPVNSSTTKERPKEVKTFKPAESSVSTSGETSGKPKALKPLDSSADSYEVIRGDVSAPESKKVKDKEQIAALHRLFTQESEDDVLAQTDADEPTEDVIRPSGPIPGVILPDDVRQPIESPEVDNPSHRTKYYDGYSDFSGWRVEDGQVHAPEIRTKAGEVFSGVDFGAYSTDLSKIETPHLFV